MTKHKENTKPSNSTKPVLCNGLKIQDLRIGNYILECGFDYNHDCKYRDYDGDKIVKIASLNSDNTIRIINDNIESGCYKLNYNFEPIKITTKWLDKLGFKFIVRNMWELKIDFYTKLQFYDNQDDYITLHIKNYKVMNFESKTYTYLKHINHIHELQNLYFALTGSELTVA